MKREQTALFFWGRADDCDGARERSQSSEFMKC